MEVSKAKANYKHVKKDLDNRSCIELVMKRSKAVAQVDALDIIDSNIEAG
jgi:hypothetical protein